MAQSTIMYDADTVLHFMKRSNSGMGVTVFTVTGIPGQGQSVSIRTEIYLMMNILNINYRIYSQSR